MSKEIVPRFEMVAITKNEVAGVEYQPGEVFYVDTPDRVRYLEKVGAAKSASSIAGGAEVSGASVTPPIANSSASADQPGTSHEQTKPPAARGRRS